MDNKYEILDKIKKIEKKHVFLKEKILSKISEFNKLKFEIEKLEKELKIIEENYVEEIEKFLNLNE